jgi:antitoxin (DNA-binding transcriptional repressor) of toxin-antitoxin stability system
MPVPETGTVCGDPVTLSARPNDTLRLPVAEGVKVTAMRHDDPVAKLVPQEFVWLKSATLVPVNEMDLIESGAAETLSHMRQLVRRSRRDVVRVSLMRKTVFEPAHGCKAGDYGPDDVPF